MKFRKQFASVPQSTHSQMFLISIGQFYNKPVSFTDSDPCTIYQDILRLKARQILDDKWIQSMHFLKNEAKRKSFKFIALVLDTDYGALSKIKSKKAHKSRSKKLKVCIPTDKEMLLPKQLVMNDEKSILLVGKPGVGKTTVALEILRLWIEEKSIQVNYRYIFYFDEPLIRIFSQSPFPQTLKSLFFHNCIPPNEASDQILENIESNSENVVLIFDSIMDVIGNTVMKQLMDKELLNDAKILTTCRPEAEDSGYLSDWSSCRVDVLGFNHESIHEYFKWMLGTEGDSGVCALDNPELFSLCSVPLYAFIVTACISMSPKKARNNRFCMKQHGDQNVEHLDKYITDNKKEIAYLALASYQVMLAKTVNLTDIDQLAEFVFDVDDEDLTMLFLEKTDGDLSPCSLSWDVLYYLIKGTNKHVTLDLPDGKFKLSNIPSLLTVLDTVRFKRQDLDI